MAQRPSAIELYLCQQVIYEAETNNGGAAQVLTGSR
jgi:hypothetical protein